MGNSFSNGQNTINDDKSIINFFIEDIFKNQYYIKNDKAFYNLYEAIETATLEEQQDILNQIKNTEFKLNDNILLNRVCCTNFSDTNKYIPVQLPFLQGSSIEYYGLNIDMSNDIDKCNTTNIITKDGFHIQSNNNVCNLTYKGDSIGKLGVCEYIYNRNQYRNKKDKYLGQYDDEPTLVDQINGFNKINTFIDCNCENSKFNKTNLVDQGIAVKDSSGNVSQISLTDPLTKAQNFDNRCSSNLNKTYNKFIDLKDNICINQTLIGEVSSSDISSQQFCEAPVDDKNNNNIIISSSLAGLLLLIFIIYKIIY
jgi:hypothetical protein